MAGLDVINEQIIEINVTSPCYFIKEINNHFGVNLEQKICDYIQNASLYYVKNRILDETITSTPFTINSQIVIENNDDYIYKTETF